MVTANVIVSQETVHFRGSEYMGPFPNLDNFVKCDCVYAYDLFCNNPHKFVLPVQCYFLFKLFLQTCLLHKLLGQHQSKN